MITCYLKNFGKFSLFFSFAILAAPNIVADDLKISENKLSEPTSNQMNSEELVDGNIKIRYVKKNAGTFSFIEVLYRDICVFRYTLLNEDGVRYYADPRSGLAVTIQFTKEGLPQTIHLIGMTSDLEKLYSWSVENSIFFLSAPEMLLE